MQRFARWLSLLLALVIFAAPLAALAEEPLPTPVGIETSGGGEKEIEPEGESPTEAPPTEQPPTEAPPTEQPPTEAPPTEAPPTEAPPTEAPPTEQPPTEQPPTEQPPTEAPPTEAPATETPAQDEEPFSGDPEFGMLLMADMPLLMASLDAGETPRIIYIEFTDGFSGEVLSRRAVVEGGSAAAFPEIPENTVYAHTGWKMTAYGNTKNFAADAETVSFADLLPSIPASKFSAADSQVARAFASIQSTYTLLDPEHAPFVLEFREREAEEGGARWREEDRMFVFADEPDRAYDLPELYLPGSCWTLLSEDYEPLCALGEDKPGISYNELMALRQQYGLGFDLKFETEANEAYSVTLSFFEKRPDAHWAFDSLGSVRLYEGGSKKPLPLLPEREGYDAFWQGVDIASGEWLGAQFEGTPSLTYAQAVEILGQQAVAEGYGRDEVSFCAYYVPIVPEGTQYRQLIYLNLIHGGQWDGGSIQGGRRVGQLIASPASPDAAIPVICPVPAGVFVTGWKLSGGTTWPAGKSTTYSELLAIAELRGLTDGTNKSISMDAEVLVDYDPENPIAVYARFGDEQDTELYAKRVMPGGSVNFPSGSREDWYVTYTLSDDGAPCFLNQRVPAGTASMTYEELLNLVSIAGVLDYYGLPTVQIYFYAPTAEQIPTGSFEQKTIDVVLESGNWLYFKDGDGSYLGLFRDSVRLTEGDAELRTFWNLSGVGLQLRRNGYQFLGWYTANGAKAIPAYTDAVTYSQMVKYVQFDSNNYARLALTPRFTFDGVSRGEQQEPVVKKLVFQDVLLTGYEKTLTLEYGKTVIAPAPPPLSDSAFKFQYWVLGPEYDPYPIKAGAKVTFNTLSTTLSKYGYMYDSVIPLYAMYAYAGSIRADEEQVDVTFYGRFNRRLTTQTVSSLTSGKQLPLPEVAPPEGMVLNGWIVYGTEGTLRWYRDKTSYCFADVRSIAGDDYWVDAYALFGAEPVENPTLPAKPSISVLNGALLYDGARLYLGYDEAVTLKAGPESLIGERGADVVWDPASSSFATLTDNNNGTLTVKAGKKAGSVSIGATFDGARTGITLDISKAPTSVSVPKTLALLVNGTAKLTATVSPKDAKPADVTWTSSNPEIATVMSNGTVDALGVGTATITARTLNGKTATCAVTVARPTAYVTMGYVFSPREIDVGGTIQLSASAYPLNALQQFTWTSGSPKIAKVGENGLVTGLAAGVVKITATSKDGTGQSDSVELTVVKPVTGISSPASVHVFKGRTVSVKASALPGAAYLNWTIGNDYYARVLLNGEVVGLHAGETTLRFTARNGVTKVIPVTVTVPVSSVRVLPADAEVEIGKALQLEATVSDAHYRGVLWSSNNTKAAKVDANGLVTGVKAGQAVITAAARDGSGVRDSVTVTVYQGVTGIKLSAAKLALTTGRSGTLTASLSPSKPKYTGIEWSSSNTGVATVANGAVTAVAPGEAVITAKAHNGLTATCAVKVTPPTQSVKIEGKGEVEVKGTLQLTASALPAGAVQEFTWGTSSSKYATVSQTGVVTGVKVGTVAITATAKDGTGIPKTFNVAVITGASGVKLSASRLILHPGQQPQTLIATVSPSNAEHKDVVWSSSDDGVATVAGGVVTAVAPGEAVITATAHNGKSALCVVKVVPATESVVITGGSEVDLKGKLQLTATALPAGALQEFTWGTSSSKYATVSQTGVVTGVKLGSATITATSKDGGMPQTFTVKVITGASGVKLSATRLILHPGQQPQTLIATVSPSNAEHKDVVWSSSDDGVATVAGGVVTAVAPGDAVITATAHNGKSALCVVKVVPATESVVITGGSEVDLKGKLQLTATALPAGALQEFEWKSSSPKNATVSQTGVVTGVKLGSATITATSKDGGTPQTFTVKVITGAASVRLSSTRLILHPGQQPQTLIATVSPSNAEHKTVVWSSSDDGVATVAGGVVTAVAPGDAVITATAHNGKSAACAVKVVPAAESVAITGGSEVEVKGKLQLTATALPVGALQEFEWKSLNTKYATVSQTGVVTGVKLGTAKITATLKDGSGVQKEFTVTVITGLSSIGLSAKSASLTPGQVLSLRPVFSPSSPTHNDVTWASSNWDVATVVNGVVVAMAPGEATITATSNYNGKSATCAVSVSNPNTKAYE